MNMESQRAVHGAQLPSRGNPPFECLRHYFFDAVAAMQHCSFTVTEVLRDLCDDPEWLEQVTRHLPTERAAAPA
jgi:hypothetical protein